MLYDVESGLSIKGGFTFLLQPAKVRVEPCCVSDVVDTGVLNKDRLAVSVYLSRGKFLFRVSISFSICFLCRA